MLAPLGAELTLTTNGALLPREGEAARGRRPEPGHRQPRLARRRDLPGAERRRLPGGAGARRDRRCRGRRPAGQGELRRQARRERRRDRRARPALPRHAAHAPLHRVHGRRRTPTAGGSTTSSRPPRSSRRSTPSCRSSRSSPATAARSARRYRYLDGGGEIGVIASVTQPFCGDCTRARLSAEGRLFTCLFAVRGHDLRALVRGGASDEELEDALRRALGSPHRPLLRAPLGGDRGARQGRDELHRRLDGHRPGGPKPRSASRFSGFGS